MNEARLGHNDLARACQAKLGSTFRYPLPLRNTRNNEVLMVGRSIHECADLVLLGDEGKKILDSAKERLARAGGDLKIKDAVSKCLKSLELSSLAGNCSLDDVRTVKRELKIAVLDRRSELDDSE